MNAFLDPTGRARAGALRRRMNFWTLLSLHMGIPEGEDIDISLLEHVSPIEWENVILYGQYVLNPDDIR